MCLKYVWHVAKWNVVILMFGSKLDCLTVDDERQKDKRVNTEFTVYYQDLEKIQTSSQLQVFRHKPV